MLITRAYAHPRRRLLAAALLAVFTLAACGAAAAPTQTPGPAPTPRSTPTAVPGEPGGGNGVGTDPGTGSGGGPVIPIPFPPDPNQNPLLGDATYLVPAPNLVDQRTVNVQLVRAMVQADGTAVADLRWWSGVAPCNQLDRVEIARDDAAKTIRLKVIEGSGQGNMMCIEIAQLSATVVDLGVLAAGTWTISVEGDAPAIPVEIK